MISGRHTGKADMAAVIFTGFDAVEDLIVFLAQCFPALRVFPYPVGKRLLDDFLLCLRSCGFLCVEYRLFIPVFVINIVKDTGVL